jgi:hypothetical protein
LTLPRDLQRRVDVIGRAIHARLQKDKLALYVCAESPVESRRAAGKRLGPVEAWQAWGSWYSQVADMRHAAVAGFDGCDLSAFYQQTVDDLEKLPPRKGYSACLFDIIKYLSQSMTWNHRISYQDMPYKDAADRLASYSLGLFTWHEERANESYDCEMLADFLVAVYKGLGLGYDSDETFGLITHRLLSSQLPDGSWSTTLRSEDAPEEQAEYLETMYRATWACINALRPMRNDVLNSANAALALI